MSAVALEAFLARLYTDAYLRARFLAAPLNEARAAGLCEADAQALVVIDRAGLEMAAASFAHKRAGHVGKRAGKAGKRSRDAETRKGHALIDTGHALIDTGHAGERRWVSLLRWLNSLRAAFGNS